jgi:hypothetical protein
MILTSQRCGVLIDGEYIDPQSGDDKITYECGCADKERQEIVWGFVLSAEGRETPPPPKTKDYPPPIPRHRGKIVMQRSTAAAGELDSHENWQRAPAEPRPDFRRFDGSEGTPEDDLSTQDEWFGAPTSPAKITSSSVVPSYLPRSPKPQYSLRVRQQPARACVGGFGGIYEQPVDPPPIIEIIEGTEELTPSALQSFEIQCSLWNEDGTQHIRTVGPTSDTGIGKESPVQMQGLYARVMRGNTSPSALHLQDEHGRLGYFCIFPDLSICVDGIYRLRFDLSIPPQRVPAVSALSDRFQVYPSDILYGMSPSSPIIVAFAKQGVKIENLL